MKKKIKYLGLSAFVFLGNAIVAFAQDPAQALNRGVSTLVSSISTFITIAMVLCGVSGAISIAWALIDRKNAQEGANQRLMNVGIGLVAAFVLLIIIKAAIGNVTTTTITAGS